MFTIYVSLLKFFTVTGFNNTIDSKFKVGNRKFNSKLPIVIEPENLRKPRIKIE